MKGQISTRLKYEESKEIAKQIAEYKKRGGKIKKEGVVIRSTKAPKYGRNL
mgnify:CR=1 FL=1